MFASYLARRHFIDACARSNKCPCEVREEALLNPSPAPEKKTATAGTASRKRARHDSQDASLATRPLRHVRMQLDATVQWALEEGLADEVASMLSDAMKTCSKKSQAQWTALNGGLS